MEIKMSGLPPESIPSDARRAEPHMTKRGAKWETWLEVDGVKVPGSEKTHDDMESAWRWLKGEDRH